MKLNDFEALSFDCYGTLIDWEAGIAAVLRTWAADHGATIVDINMGCPVDKVTKKDGGSRLLCIPDSAVEIARACARVLAKLGLENNAALVRYCIEHSLID